MYQLRNDYNAEPIIRADLAQKAARGRSIQTLNDSFPQKLNDSTGSEADKFSQTAERPRGLGN